MYGDVQRFASKKVQGCRSVPQKIMFGNKAATDGTEIGSIYIDIGVSPGFGGFDSGPNPQPCKMNGWNLQTTRLQKENDLPTKPPWGHGTQPLIFQGCTTLLGCPWNLVRILRKLGCFTYWSGHIQPTYIGVIIIYLHPVPAGHPSLFGLVSSFMTSVCCDFVPPFGNAEAKIAHGEVWRLASASRQLPPRCWRVRFWGQHILGRINGIWKLLVFFRKFVDEHTNLMDFMNIPKQEGNLGEISVRLRFCSPAWTPFRTPLRT